MGPHVTNPCGLAFLAQIIFVMLFMFPDFSLLLWQNLSKRWTTKADRMIMKRRKAAEKKKKRYWEIDLSNLK